MKLTRQQKVLGGLVGAGLCAVIVDRAFLAESVSGPEAAAAGAYAVDTPRGGDGIAKLVANLPATTATGGSVAERLAAHAAQQKVDIAQTRDGFRPSDAWVMPVAEKAAAEPAPKDDAMSRFAAEHRLMAVMGSGDRAVAIVDGQPLRAGQRVDGFTLVQVRARSVVFAAPVGRVELTLADGP